MGAGKTTVGKQLAEKLKNRFDQKEILITIKKIGLI